MLMVEVMAEGTMMMGFCVCLVAERALLFVLELVLLALALLFASDDSEMRANTALLKILRTDRKSY